MARLELVSTQHAHCLIDALEDTLVALPMGDMFAHTVGGLAPLHSRHTDYTLTVPRQFYRWGLDCNMVENSDISDCILPRPTIWPLRSSILSTTTGIPLEAEPASTLSTPPCQVRD
jgi:hypothetical protein